MSTSFMSLAACVCLVASTSTVHAKCGPALSEQIVSAERIIDSLRPDKVGQMRVFASDGSEYPAGEALWMKGQMKVILEACAKGDETSAAAHLQEVTTLMKNRHRG